MLILILVEKTRRGSADEKMGDWNKTERNCGVGGRWDQMVRLLVARRFKRPES